MRTLSIITALTLLAGCGLELNVQSDKKKDDYRYELEENGCNTGKHKFKTKSAYCDGLLNDEMNHSCAASMRARMHQSACE